MITYQDLLAIGKSDKERMAFCYSAIEKHKTSQMYRTARIAEKYDAKQNVTINEYKKLIYDVTGRAVHDPTGDGFKLVSARFPFFVDQRVIYLLGNGVSWENEGTEDALGENFDNQLKYAAHVSLVDGEAYGFFNLDHVDVFKYTEYVPMYDEETGALRAGIRFWQLDENRPLRAVLYEEDGYTGYMWKDGEGEVRSDKQAYIIKATKPSDEEDVIYEGENYPTFPIVPFFSNRDPQKRQSVLVGSRESIDCYDLMKSGFANTVEEASYIYWAIQNAPGMTDSDLVEFVDKMKKLHAAVTEDQGAKVDAHSVEAPTQSREAILTRLKDDLYEDFGAFDLRSIVSGATVTAQIKAAQMPLDMQATELEYNAIQFIQGILNLAGIEDNPTFTRDRLTNTTEEVNTVLMAAESLDDEYVTTKILNLLGDGDQIEEILERKDADELEMGGVLDEEIEEGMEEDMEEGTEDMPEDDAIQQIVDRLKALMEEL